MKKCSKCGRELLDSEFYKSSKASDGLQSYCKGCSNRVVGKKTATSGGGNPDLVNFTPRQLIDELRARGYTGKLIYTKEITL